MGFTLDEMDDIYLSLGSRVFAPGKAAKEAQARDAGGDAKAVQAASEGWSWMDPLSRMYNSGQQSMRVAWYGSKYSADVFEKLLRDKTRLRDHGCDPPLG